MQVGLKEPNLWNEYGGHLERGSCSHMFFKIDVFRNFVKFTWKHQCWSPSLIKFLNFIKKSLKQRCFPVNITTFLRATFLQCAFGDCFCLQLTNNWVRQHLKSMECVKGCVRYIFASLVLKSKREQLSNQEKCFLFHFKSSFLSRENQTLKFCIFKFHDVIDCLSVKREIYFTE